MHFFMNKIVHAIVIMGNHGSNEGINGDNKYQCHIMYLALSYDNKLSD